MEITDILAQAGGIQSIARELGVSEAEAASGARALVPAIVGGFKKQVQSRPGGLDGLGGLLGQLGGGSLFDDVLSPQPTNVSQGDNVLGQIFGSKDVSRTVAQSASAQTGLEPSLLKKMLPMLAMLVTGYLAKKQGGGSADHPASSGGGLGDVLGGMFGGGSNAGAGATTGDASPGIGSMLDLNRDGNVLDDILRMAGKAMR